MNEPWLSGTEIGSHMIASIVYSSCSDLRMYLQAQTKRHKADYKRNQIQSKLNALTQARNLCTANGWSLKRLRPSPIEELLQTLVGEVDAELFEAVVFERFEAKHVQNANPLFGQGKSI